MFQVYKPSGGVGLLTAPSVVVGLVAAIGLAYLYQLLLRWIPLVYINGLLSFGVGMALGYVAARVVRRGEIRNPAVAIAIGVALATTGLAAKYYFQYRWMLGTTVAEVMRANQIPDSLRAKVRRDVAKDLSFARHIQFRTDRGWNIGKGARGGIPIKGGLVYLIWLAEAGVIGFFAVRAPRAQAKEPYSESRRAWASDTDIVMTLPISDPAMVEKILAADRVEELLELPIPQSDVSNQFAVYTVHSLPGEEMEDAYLSVSLETWMQNNRGESEKTVRPLVKNAVLPVALRKQLVENASLLQEALEAYRLELQAEAAAEAALAAESDDQPAPGN